MTADLQVVFQTRHSFLGSSGWRSGVSKDKGLLFDPGRLTKRFDLFRKPHLASLRDQGDGDFKRLILTSTELPDQHAAQVQEASRDILGAERAHFIQRRPGSAGAWLRKYMRNQLNGTALSAQVVLDDDDAVSADFVQPCRPEAAFALTQFRDGQDCASLSFASGLTGRFEADGGMHLIPREVPSTNLGLTLVAPTTTRKNPSMLAHQKAARRHAVRVIHEKRPFCIRGGHGTDMPGGDAVRAAMPWFPLLRDLDLVALRDQTGPAT